MFDHYQTIAAPAEATTKVQRSVFQAFALPLTSEQDFAPLLETLQKQFFDATHHCWAWRMVGEGGEARSRSSDAGEPSGTAGKPILSAIEGAALYELAVVVVRYYGGVKLGTGGLGRAYREAAAEALQAADRVDRYLYTRLELEVPFEMTGVIHRMIAPPDVLLIDQRYGESPLFTIDVRRSRADSVERQLQERRIVFRHPPP